MQICYSALWLSSKLTPDEITDEMGRELRSILTTMVATFRSSGLDMKSLVQDLTNADDWYIMIYLLDACVALAKAGAHLFDRDVIDCLGDLALKCPSDQFVFDDMQEGMKTLREAVNQILGPYVFDTSSHDEQRRLTLMVSVLSIRLMVECEVQARPGVLYFHLELPHGKSRYVMPCPAPSILLSDSCAWSFTLRAFKSKMVSIRRAAQLRITWTHYRQIWQRICNVQCPY